MVDRIYIQIPAYRDPELLPTVLDLLRTARHPDRLTVAIAWQHGPDEAGLAGRLEALPGVRLLQIPAAESQGCNWARSLLQQRWDGERYTLLLDSHHRFVPGWDVEAIRLLEDHRAAGAERPVLTAYLPPYRPGDDADAPARLRAVYDLAVAERAAGLAYRLVGQPVAEWRQLPALSPSRFVSLHFLLADGTFNAVVPCDPDVYFFADEVAMALRAFSHGYDLVRPNAVLGWHLYDRSTRGTHWSDHRQWEERHHRSMGRLRALYRGELAGAYGLGDRRTVDDYESFTNIRLVEPVRPTREPSWNSHLVRSIASSSG